MIIVPEERIRKCKELGWWGDLKIDDYLERWFLNDPDGEALVDPANLREVCDLAPRRMTWRQIREGVTIRAAMLHRFGLRKDDVVLMQMPNSAEQTLIYLAAFHLGIIVSPAPAQYRLNELSSIVRKVNAKAAITTRRIGRHDHAELFAELAAEIPSLALILVAGEAPAGMQSLVAAMGDGTLSADERREIDALASAVTPDDVATICWTSGTEAEPKGVPRSQNEWLIMGRANLGGIHLPVGARVLCPFPMVNMAGISTGIMMWVETGGVLVLHHPFDQGVFLKQIVDENIDYTVVAPTLLNSLLQDENLNTKIDFSRLTKIGSGSAPLSEWMVRTFHERHRVEIINVFGSNEGASFLANSIDVPDPAERAIYFPRYGNHGFEWDYKLADQIETRLVDAETEEEIIEPGRPGELRVRGATIFSGYWQNEEATARAFDADGWYRSGDLFEIRGERNQYHHFVGRLKDVVIRGGMNISANELENHLLAHPDVKDVAIIGVPDPYLGERVCACIVPARGGVTIEALNEFLVREKRVALFKQIERLHILDELPRNPVGKIVKRALCSQILKGVAG